MKLVNFNFYIATILSFIIVLQQFERGDNANSSLYFVEVIDLVEEHESSKDVEKKYISHIESYFDEKVNGVKLLLSINRVAESKESPPTPPPKV
jgi:hypothetical protein